MEAAMNAVRSSGLSPVTVAARSARIRSPSSWQTSPCPDLLFLAGLRRRWSLRRRRCSPPVRGGNDAASLPLIALTAHGVWAASLGPSRVPKAQPLPARSASTNRRLGPRPREFRKRSECEDSFDYVGSSSSRIRSSSKRDLSCRYR